MVDPRLGAHRAAWAGKPALRAVYEDTYRRIVRALPPGPVLEVGGGSGHLKSAVPAVVATDVLPAPWLDAVADAHRLPFADASFAGLVMVDVLHHLAAPAVFLAEAARILRQGGRLVLVEPEITPVSRLAFALAHPEPVDLSVDPLAALAPPAARDPFEANQAIPTLMLRRHRDRLSAMVPGLAVIELRRFGLLAYPLSGGYRRWSLVPAALVPALLRFEDALAPLLGAVMAFRLFAVLERR
ncbi:MAG: methyltransferase domain-containing protein [Alphaproteobacteria bacterium]